MDTFIKALMVQVEKSGRGCWLWRGPLNKTKSDGQVRCDGRIVSVRRSLYEHHKGSCAGRHLRVSCATLCVNPGHVDPEPVGVHRTKQTFEQRFWEKVVKYENGCWEHPAGSVRFGARTVSPRRLAWQFLGHSEMSENQQLRAHCLNPECINPAHMDVLRVALGGVKARTRPRAFALSLENFDPGEVDSIRRRFKRRVSVDARSGCWLWTGKPRNGYGQFHVRSLGMMVPAHRAGYALFKGPIPEGALVRHGGCHNSKCVNPDHMELGTHADNMRDRARDGTSNRGERNGMARLTEAEVRAIRRGLVRGQPYRDLGKQFKVSDSVIGDIARGKTWGHL